MCTPIEIQVERSDTDGRCKITLDISREKEHDQQWDEGKYGLRVCGCENVTEFNELIKCNWIQLCYESLIDDDYQTPWT